jgi:uncharacterized membrane protein
MALVSSDGWLFLLRWIHFLAGIAWIGLLYYFNFVQTPFFAETEPAVRSGAVQKLVPRALWWFRWAAMVTFLSGWIYLLHQLGRFGGVRDFFATSYGWAIFLGGTLGSFMWANVWFVIWPAQKVVIASATQAAHGGQAIPEAAQMGARAAIVSRTNVLFSIPMLFFMGAASHLPFEVSPEVSLGLLALVFMLLFAAVEANALKGKMGYMATVKGVVHLGILFSALLYGLMEVIL